MDSGLFVKFENFLNGDALIVDDDVIYFSDRNDHSSGVEVPPALCHVKKFSFYPRVLSKAEVFEYMAFYRTPLSYSHWDPSWSSSTGSLSLLFEAKTASGNQQTTPLRIGLFAGTLASEDSIPPEITDTQLVAAANAADSTTRMYEVIVASGKVIIRYGPQSSDYRYQGILFTFATWSDLIFSDVGFHSDETLESIESIPVLSNSNTAMWLSYRYNEDQLSNELRFGIGGTIGQDQILQHSFEHNIYPVSFFTFMSDMNAMIAEPISWSGIPAPANSYPISPLLFVDEADGYLLVDAEVKPAAGTIVGSTITSAHRSSKEYTYLLFLRSR